MRHSNTTTIYLVRHGKIHNPKNIFYARLPRFGLGEEGKKQLEATGKFLATQNISHIYTSPLLRARQSAHIINKQLQLPRLSLSKKLLEVKTSLQGKPFDYIRSINLDFYTDSYRSEGDERLEDIEERMMEFFRQMHQKHTGENIVAVTHGDPIIITTTMLNNIPLSLTAIRPPEEKYPGYGEVFRIVVDKDTMQVTPLFRP